MKRRQFVSCFTVLAAILRTTYAQQSAPRRIGVLLATSSTKEKAPTAFRHRLLEEGYTEGRDLLIEWRSANGHYERLPQLAADLVRLKVDVIVVESTPAAEAAKRATSTIPIVMAVVSDPIGSHLVTSLSYPGGNITGVSAMGTDISAKRLQLLKETIPGLTRVGVMWNPNTTFHWKVIEEFRTLGQSLSMHLTFVRASTAEELTSAFLSISRARVQVLYIVPDAFFFDQRPAIFKLAAKARLAVASGERQWAEAGGVVSYGPGYSDLFRRSADYVDKILKGANPTDLPIEQPSKFELIVNLKTAKALGITIPESILLRADEVMR